MVTAEISNRRVSFGDAKTIRCWRNDPNVLQFQRNSVEIELEDHLKWFNSRLERVQQEPFEAFMLAGQVIGFLRMEINDNSEGFISIILSPSLRGQGIGFFLLSKFLEILESHKEPRLFVAEIHKDNHPSIKIFERCGFVKEAQIDEDFSRYVLLRK